MANPKFSWSSVITTSLLVGFIGFGLGFNWQNLQNFYQARVGDRQQLPADLDFATVENIYDSLRENYAGELDVDKLLEGAKQGLVKATGDPNTAYLGEQAAQEFQQSLSGTFSGIGAEIAIKNDRLVVVAPLADTPAKLAGLQAGDFIAQINGESSENLSVEEAVAKIRGEAGTEVTLSIVRGNDNPKEYKITRAVIEVPSVRSELKAPNVGYIEITRFGEDTSAKLTQAATDLRAQGATKFIIDVR